MKDPFVAFGFVLLGVVLTVTFFMMVSFVCGA